MIFSGLLPTLLFFLPFEVWIFGWKLGVFHSVFQLQIGLVLIEAFFWKFDKVPFTCSYCPSKANLALLSGLYLYGFTSYSFRMADLQSALESSLPYSVLFFSFTACGLVIAWKWRAPYDSIRFDGAEPALQILDLS